MPKFVGHFGMTPRWSLVAVGALVEARQRMLPLLAPARRLVGSQLRRSARIRRWEVRGEEIEARGRRAAQHVVEDTLDDLFTLLRKSDSTWSFVDDVVRHLIANRDVRDLVNDIVAFLVDHPLILALVREQSVGFTDEVIQASRNELARADAIVDQVVYSVWNKLSRRERAVRRVRGATTR